MTEMQALQYLRHAIAYLKTQAQEEMALHILRTARGKIYAEIVLRTY